MAESKGNENVDIILNHAYNLRQVEKSPVIKFVCFFFEKNTELKENSISKGGKKKIRIQLSVRYMIGGFFLTVIKYITKFTILTHFKCTVQWH